MASRRKFSTGTEGETPPALLEKTNSFSSSKMDFETRKNLAQETIPESPRQDTAPAALKFSGTKAGASGSSLDTKKTDVEEPKPKYGDPKSKAAVKKNGTLAPNGGVGEGLNGTAPAKDKPKTTGKEPAKATTASKAPAKVTPISTTSKAAGKPAKSPTTVKTPTSATHAPKLSAKTPERKKALEPEKPSTPKVAATTPKTTPAGSSAKRPAPIHISPSSTGFIKPKPKSPTRPVQLPPGLTTHTAASGSRINPPRQSLSRASGSFQTHHPTGRSPSRASVSTVGTAATGTTKNLKRQNSVINRPRPSFGPPPKQLARDHPPTKREKEVDEGFLARMMRPTQASSSKVLDKLPSITTTPPRKTAVAHAPVKKTVSAPKHVPKAAAGIGEAAKKPVGKPTAATAAEPQRQPEPAKAERSAAKDIAPLVEQASSAEEAIKVARAAEGTVELPRELGTETAARDPTPEIKIEEPSSILEEHPEDAEERDDHEEPEEPNDDERGETREAEPAEDVHVAKEPAVNGEHDGPADPETEGDGEVPHEDKPDTTAAAVPEQVAPAAEEDHAETEDQARLEGDDIKESEVD